MTLDQILKHANSILNKDRAGNVYSIDRFNIDLPFFLWEFLNKRYGLPSNWRPGGSIPHFGSDVTQLMTDDLSPLKIVMGGLGPDDPGALSVNTNGYAILPENYYHYLALNGFTTQGECDDTKMPAIEVCTDQQFSEWRTNTLRNKRLDRDPYCNFQNGYIEFMPKTVGMVRFVYLKKFTNPFYDYYTIAATLQTIYLQVGEIFTATTANIYRTGATSGTFTSLTEELPIAEYLHGDFSNQIVDLMSVHLRSAFLKQTSQLREGKDA